MKYVIETNYAWYNKESTLILVYFINGVPFTFDELPEIAKQHPEVIEIANSEKLGTRRYWNSVCISNIRRMPPDVV